MIEPENQLEEEFIKVYKEFGGEIQSRLDLAAQLINEAKELSEEHGLPFKPKGQFHMSYIPHTLKIKFPDLDREFWGDVTGAHGGYDYLGWQHSQVC